MHGIELLIQNTYMHYKDHDIPAMTIGKIQISDAITIIIFLLSVHVQPACLMSNFYIINQSPNNSSVDFLYAILEQI